MKTDYYDYNEDLVLVLGDTHGNLEFLREAVNRICIPHGVEIIHVVGDFGYWTHTRAGKEFLDSLDSLAKMYGILITFVDGNHEYFPGLYDIPVSGDGWRHVTENIWHAPRGHSWQWGDLTFFGMGGANSIDGPGGPSWWKARMGQARGPLENGKDLGNWWPEEDITDKDVTRAINAMPSKVDIMFAHDAPTVIDLPGIGGYHAGDENRKRLQTVFDAAEPRFLIHGHYHMFHQQETEHGQSIGLAHDQGRGQYCFINTTDHTNPVIIPEW